MGEQSETWRSFNVGLLLVRALRRFEAAIVAYLRAGGHAEARMSYLKVVLHLSAGGRRITDLANRAAMTKQAMSELVMQCEALGLVRRIPDLEDARAKIVALTPKGLEWFDALGEAVEQAEGEMRQTLGEKETGRLIAALKAYSGFHAHEAPRTARAIAADRSKAATLM